MLKVDFHAHTSLDPIDNISHTPEQFIDRAAKEGFDVVCLTHHDGWRCPRDVIAYGRKKGVLVIPGAEATLDGAHILLVNITQKDLQNLKTMTDLAKIRRKDTLIIAPHPFYLHFVALGKKLFSHSSFFDAIEYSHFYTTVWNRPNKKAVAFARRHKLPVVGTSDCHDLRWFGTTYTLVDTKSKTPRSIVKAVKAGKVKVVSKPIPFFQFIHYFLWAIWRFVTGTEKRKP